MVVLCSVLHSPNLSSLFFRIVWLLDKKYSTFCDSEDQLCFLNWLICSILFLEVLLLQSSSLTFSRLLPARFWTYYFGVFFGCKPASGFYGFPLPVSSVSHVDIPLSRHSYSSSFSRLDFDEGIYKKYIRIALWIVM